MITINNSIPIYSFVGVNPTYQNYQALLREKTAQLSQTQNNPTIRLISNDEAYDLGIYSPIEYKSNLTSLNKSNEELILETQLKDYLQSYGIEKNNSMNYNYVFRNDGAYVEVSNTAVYPPEVGDPFNVSHIEIKNVTLFISWDELLNSKNMMNTENIDMANFKISNLFKKSEDFDGYFYLDHHIFGEIDLTYNSDYDELKNIIDKWDNETKLWYMANGKEPDLIHKNWISENIYYETSVSSEDMDINRYGLSIVFNDFYNKRTTLSKLISEYKKHYDDISSLKENAINEIQDYFSFENINKRIEHAGITDRELISNIIETQLKRGELMIVQAQTRGDVNLTKTYDENLTDFLSGSLASILGIIDYGSNSFEIAKAIVSGGTVKLGEYEMTTSQFIKISDTLTYIFNDFSDVISTRKHFSSQDESKQYFDRMFNMINNVIKDLPNNLSNNIKQWYNDLTENFVDIQNAYYVSLLQQLMPISKIPLLKLSDFKLF